ncbi:hypothetical protein M378DRAFT_166773 [Amanita muscaria Koide BX008]|uniref:Uncharacterized protein n=1 Tax=Amanita muscaria (strain Koide BX008) TaxID=946122 RepID=A0A0C2WYN9_AMAMK|nr:hypothetical protein M378DRAFT_166773 [Amanita muscaria Koide BX008]
MYLHFGGYKCTPEQIHALFKARGVELVEGWYTVLANRYLSKENLKARLRSYDYEGHHCFLIVTHKTTTDDSIPSRRGVSFEENDHARSIKAEMGLQDVEFVTTAVYV